MQTKIGQKYIQVPSGCTEAQALTALYALFFLPVRYHIVFTPAALSDSLKLSLVNRANEINLADRVNFTDNPDQFSSIISTCAESPEAFASQVLVKLR